MRRARPATGRRRRAQTGLVRWSEAAAFSKSGPASCALSSVRCCMSSFCCAMSMACCDTSVACCASSLASLPGSVSAMICFPRLERSLPASTMRSLRSSIFLTRRCTSAALRSASAAGAGAAAGGVGFGAFCSSCCFLAATEKGQGMSPCVDEFSASLLGMHEPQSPIFRGAPRACFCKQRRDFFVGG